MRGPEPIARRWPRRSRASAVLAASVLASVFAFGATGVQPAPVAAAAPPWQAVETYYLRLINCTRTGGWVKPDGSCAGYGTGKYSKYVAPLKLSAGLSKVARAWAKNLAKNNRCAHGSPGARLRAAGFRGSSWGENIGCGGGGAVYASVLASHRAMQAEKSYNGGHWRNMKNPAYKSVGIGVWKAGSRIRVVSDFFKP